MKRFLLSTALTTILASAVIGGHVTASFAQTTPAATSDTSMVAGMENFVAPEGFARYEGENSISIEELQGASIYDPTGNEIGKISDLVLTTSAPDATMGAAATDTTTGMAADGTATGTDATTSTDSTTGMAADSTATSTDSTTGTTATVPTTGMAADGTATGTDTPTGTDSTTGMAADSTATGTDTTAGTDSTTGMAADGTATGTDSTTGAPAPASPTGMPPDPTAAATTATGTATADTSTAAAPQEGTLVGSKITHVVVDSGGFLGMGVHSVALPIEALVIYANANDDYRIYLPWTKDQLRALPQYNKDDPSTLSQNTTN
ncbi:MAG: hypothetical protein H7245_22905 [Candidatus Saccharibacteria bacterium]|nr:hypothetical protein [Pseudorhodobacter sp.]